MENQETKSNRNLLMVGIAAIIVLLIGTIIYFSTSENTEQNVLTEDTQTTPASSDQTEEPEESSVDTEVVEAAAAELEIDVVRVEPTGEVVAAGRYAPNSIVSMANGDKVLGKTKANVFGEWVIVFEENLPPGSYQFQIITQLDEDSDEIVHDTEVTVLVPENPVSEEVLVAVNTGEGATEVLQLPGESGDGTNETEADSGQVAGIETETDTESETDTEIGTKNNAVSDSDLIQETETVSVEEEDVESEPAVEVEEDPSFVTIRAVESEDGKIFVAGEGNEGATIVVIANDEFLGHVTPNAQNRWLLEAEMELEPGTHDITARVMDTSTHTAIASVSVKFEKEEDSEILIPQVSVLQSGASGTAGDSTDIRVNSPPSVIIRRGDNLWRISRRLYGRGIRYTTIYEANKDQIDDPDLIFPGQIFLTPKRDLNWTE